MKLLGRLREYVHDANTKAKEDMAKVRDDWHETSDQHRADLAAAKERKREQRSAGQ